MLMKIDHVALWTKNLEEMKSFYIKYFEGKANEKYYNPKRNFESYFITFVSGARLELMRLPNVVEQDYQQRYAGFTHIAFSVGSKEKVDSLTAVLKEAGYTVISEPRVTGDGYYESCILDPGENQIEITE